MNDKLIHNFLKNAGISAGDTLFIHGDSIAIMQVTNNLNKDSFDNFFNIILNYLGSNGTLIVPSYSYSFTKNEIFDVMHTPSEVGIFSEFFRLKKGVVRTPHPIFSICIDGNEKDLFLNATINDCFGINTIFDLLFKKNAKIMNLGCNFEITFIHYIEQLMSVSYRSFKYFNGIVIHSNQTKSSVITSYFVRKLDTYINWEKIKFILKANCAIKVNELGRVCGYTVEAKVFKNLIEDLIRDNEYNLIMGDNFDK